MRLSLPRRAGKEYSRFALHLRLRLGMLCMRLASSRYMEVYSYDRTRRAFLRCVCWVARKIVSLDAGVNAPLAPVRIVSTFEYKIYSLRQMTLAANNRS